MVHYLAAGARYTCKMEQLGRTDLLLPLDPFCIQNARNSRLVSVSSAALISLNLHEKQLQIATGLNRAHVRLLLIGRKKRVQLCNQRLIYDFRNCS